MRMWNKGKPMKMWVVPFSCRLQNHMGHLTQAYAMSHCNQQDINTGVRGYWTQSLHNWTQINKILVSCQLLGHLIPQKVTPYSKRFNTTHRMKLQAVSSSSLSLCFEWPTYISVILYQHTWRNEWSWPLLNIYKYHIKEITEQICEIVSTYSFYSLAYSVQTVHATLQ
jgi:hypothetical protein